MPARSNGRRPPRLAARRAHPRAGGASASILDASQCTPQRRPDNRRTRRRRARRLHRIRGGDASHEAQEDSTCSPSAAGSEPSPRGAGGAGPCARQRCCARSTTTSAAHAIVARAPRLRDPPRSRPLPLRCPWRGRDSRLGAARRRSCPDHQPHLERVRQRLVIRIGANRVIELAAELG